MTTKSNTTLKQSHITAKITIPKLQQQKRITYRIATKSRVFESDDRIKVIFLQSSGCSPADFTVDEGKGTSKALILMWCPKLSMRRRFIFITSFSYNGGIKCTGSRRK